jgi:twinkle protein
VAEQLAVHQPCDDCDSSDALAVYEWGTKCYSCGTTKVNKTQEYRVQSTRQLTKIESNMTNINDLVYASVTSRGITRDTCLAYGIGVKDGNTYFPYYDSQETLVAFKRRSVAEKKFSIEGEWKTGTLFGQQLFTKGGKYVTITEGEFDAAATYQMLGSKYPVVSVRNGAASAVADCKANYEWLDSFDSIVLCFDNDAPGREAAAAVAEIFGGKAKVFKGVKDYKDACDYSKENKGKDFVDLWWKAERYTPDGIVPGAGLWSLVNQPVEKAEVMYPYIGMNDLTYGIRLGELVTITAGSGLGKSQFLREIVYHIINNSKDNIGLMFLEESVKKTAKSIMSLHANKPLHLPDTQATDQELREAFDATLGTERVFLFDHFGSTAVDNIINRVRFLAKGLNCKYIFLDHVSIVVSAQENGDERKALDEIMTKLRMIVQETGIALFCVSHLKRPDGKGHEEGAATSLSSLRGSGSIGQLSDLVIGLERNGQSDDIKERHTTKVRVLKNRFSGLTGPSCSLFYDKFSGRMFESFEDTTL